MSRGDLRGGAGVVATTNATTNATTLAGVTPTAAGLALLDDADAAAQRTTLGLGTIATQAANNVSISGGSITGITDLSVADGGTGGSTPAAARDGVLWASAAAIDPASPYTVAAGIDRVTFASSKTMAPRALSNYVDGQTIYAVNSSASTITVTIAPADGTIDGSASVAFSVPPHGVVGCLRTSSSTWVSVQPGALIANGLRWYVSGSTVYALPVNVNGSTVTDLGSAVAATTADPSSFAAVGSGADIVVPSGAVGISSALGAHGQRWGWSLASLGLTAPATPFIGNTRLTVTSITGTRGGAPIHLLAGFGTSATAPQRANGLYIGTTGTSNSYSILVSAGGGLPTNATGATTMTGSQNSQWYGTAITTTYWATRLDSGVPASLNTMGSAPSVSSTPTHFTLYLYVETGTLTNAITYTSPTGLVWWTAPT